MLLFFFNWSNSSHKSSWISWVIWQCHFSITRVQWSRHAAVSWSLWSRCLIRALSRSFHKCPIKHNMRCKLKQGPKGQANLGGSSCMVPWKILKFEVAKECAISCTLRANKAKQKKFHLLNTIFFMKPLSLLVLIYSYMRANFIDIRFYSQWSSAVLMRTLWLISVDIPAITTIPHAWQLQRYFSSAK